MKRRRKDERRRKGARWTHWSQTNQTNMNLKTSQCNKHKRSHRVHMVSSSHTITASLHMVSCQLILIEAFMISMILHCSIVLKRPFADIVLSKQVLRNCCMQHKRIVHHLWLSYLQAIPLGVALLFKSNFKHLLPGSKKISFMSWRQTIATRVRRKQLRWSYKLLPLIGSEGRSGLQIFV